MMANNNNNALLMAEIGPDGLARENPVIAYTEKVIEEEQLQLRKYIDENYTKIRDVEREFANLTMELKLTAGPKKAALEHMRKKIEMSTKRIHAAKIKEEQAKKAWELAAKAVQDEEAVKQKLCQDLNNLVQEGSNSQLTRLEELKRRLEALNPNRPNHVDTDGRPAQATTTQDSNTAAVIPNTSEASCGIVSNDDKNGSTAAATAQKQQLSEDVEGRGKKKSILQGKVKGIALSKGRGHAGSGWTGAGFDVDGRG